MYKPYRQISFVFGVYFVWFPLDGIALQTTWKDLLQEQISKAVANFTIA